MFHWPSSYPVYRKRYLENTRLVYFFNIESNGTMYFDLSAEMTDMGRFPPLRVILDQTKKWKIAYNSFISADIS